MVCLYNLCTAPSPPSHFFFLFSWHLANPRCWEDWGIAPFHPSIQPKVHIPDEDEATDEEYLDRVGEVASSFSCDLLNRRALSCTSAPSANPAVQLVFKYDVDEAVLRAERGRLHEWTNVEFPAICKKHGLSVRRAKGGVMGRVTAHDQQVYKV